MIDQLDLFATSNCDYEEEQKELEKQRNLTLKLEKLKKERQEFLTKNLTPRQHRLVDYLEEHFESGKFFSIEELCATSLGYELNTNPYTHDKCVALGNDIRQINWRIGSRYSIIVKDKKGGCKLCESQQELDDWRKEEKRPLVKKLEYLNNLTYKASWHDTAPLINLNDRALDIDEIEFVDVFKGEQHDKDYQR